MTRIVLCLKIKIILMKFGMSQIEKNHFEKLSENDLIDSISAFNCHNYLEIEAEGHELVE